MNKLRRSLENNGEYEVNLPEIVVTPRGNYINYTGTETIAPSLKDFQEAEINKARVNAINSMLVARSPSIPDIPARTPLSILAGKLGASDDTRKFVFGKNENGTTCIYSVTDKYGDPDAEVSGNKTFAKNPEKYGFKKVSINKVKAGDLMQFSDFIGPHHSTMVTGFNKDGIPVVSYSNGERVDTTWVDDETGHRFPIPTMNKDVEVDSSFISELGKPAAYRYVGTNRRLKGLQRRYNYLYNNRK